ncbi:MAG TPA: hypothetical protein VH988_24050 [Thermoanaerobaculia bacterium]|jgi:hypothetical protein|nr:hypothetical protein [Thermoanaerobaculia bacterium]
MIDIIPRNPRAAKELALVASVGLILILMNMPTFLTRAVVASAPEGAVQAAALWPIQATQESLSFLQQPTPELVFVRLMTWNFLLLLAFLFAVVVSAVRHRDAGLLGFCAGGLVLGFSALHLISWLALLLIKLVGLILLLLNWVFLAVQWCFSQWFILLPAIALVLIWLARDWISENLASLKGHLGDIASIALVIALGAGFVALLRWLGPLVSHWLWGLLGPYLGPFFHVVGVIIKFTSALLLFLLAATFVLSLVGRLLVDQVRAAWNAGKGRKEMALAGFALGSALALVVLASVGAPRLSSGVNSGWINCLGTLDRTLGANVASSTIGWIQPTTVFVATMPASVERFVLQHFDNANPPLVDSLILLIVLAMATISVTLALFLSREESTKGYSDYFLPREYLEVFGGLLFAVVLLFVAAASEGDQS